MSTIRNLCTKCIVLNKGHIIFNGDVEEAISVYMDTSDQSLLPYYDFSNFRRCSASYGTKLKINYVEFVDRKTAVYKNTEKILVRVRWHAIDEMDIRFGLSVKFCDGSAVGLAESTDIIKTTSDTDYMTELTFDLSNLVPGIYHTYLEPYYLNDTSSSFTVDETGVMPIEIIEGKGSSYRNWLRQYWSSVRLNDVAIISNQKG